MKITIMPNQVVKGFEGESIMEILVRNQIPISNVCSGKGSCGKCKVRIRSRPLEPTQLDLKHLTSQEIEEGFRLSCGVKAEEGMEIEPVVAKVYDRKETVLSEMLQINLDHGVQKVKVPARKIPGSFSSANILILTVSTPRIFNNSSCNRFQSPRSSSSEGLGTTYRSGGLEN